LRTSAARTANPSIAELSNRGRSSAARTPRARTLPHASPTRTVSAAMGRARKRIFSSAWSGVISGNLRASS
jgi:hypothetical protein